MKTESPPQGSAEEPASPKNFWSMQIYKNSSEFAKRFRRPVPREHRRPPILKPGVLGHAFVAAAGALQNGKLKQCNFEVETSEGSRQFLIVLDIFNRSRVEEWNTPLEISLVGKFFA